MRLFVHGQQREVVPQEMDYQTFADRMNTLEQIHTEAHYLDAPRTPIDDLAANVALNGIARLRRQYPEFVERMSQETTVQG